MKKESILNLWWQFIYLFTVFITVFIIRKILLSIYGIEFIGIISFFSDVIVFLGIMELGISNVIVFNLYRPLNKNNNVEISKLLNFIKNRYKKIFGLTLFIGLILTPIIMYMVGNYSISIILIYLAFVVKKATNYVFTYKCCLLRAQKKNYIYNKIISISQILLFVVSIIILLLTKKYLIALIIEIVINLGANYFVKKKINYTEEINNVSKMEEQKLNFQVKNTLIIKICSLISDVIDGVIIVIFGNNTTLGLYSNYYLIINSVKKALNYVQITLVPIFGNYFINTKNIFQKFQKANILFLIISVFSGLLFYIFSDDIIKIWIGKEYVLDSLINLSFSLNLSIYVFRIPLFIIINGCGFFEIDKKGAVFGTILNMIISIPLFVATGIAGVLFGTLISQIFQYVIKYWHLKKQLLK